MSFRFFVFLFLVSNLLFSQEFRGTWIARNTLSSKESLAYAIDSLAKNNFNVIFINVWSRGYPLWKSQVFKAETGVEIDPTYAGRDILAETIAEAHKHGLHVEAWFEYGFVGGWQNNMPAGQKGPIFNAHPDWVAKKQNGTEIDGSNFYWMVHTRKDVQDFIIGLVTEMCRNYDLDGIELDRIRYSSTDYGYDAYTDSLYRLEHNNQPPPQNGADAGWIRWRADKLNDFVARAYDSVKSISQRINVSNAPSLYSSNSYTAYQSFCQDWVWWVNTGKVDNVQVQSYVTSLSSFNAIMDYISNTLITDKTKVYPALAVKPNNTPLSNEVVASMIQSTRAKGFKGNAIWYLTDLQDYFQFLKQGVYSQKAHVPHSPADWREYYKIINLSDTADIVKTGAWGSGGLVGNQGFCISVNSDAPASIEYYADIPMSGHYDIYTYNVIASNRTDSARTTLVDSAGNSQVIYIPQNNALFKRWTKAGTVYLQAGRRMILKYDNSNLAPGKFLNADAVYFKLNRLLSPNVLTGIEVKKKVLTDYSFDLKGYPNPFNPEITLNYRLPGTENYTISVHNILGSKVLSRQFEYNGDEKGDISLNMEKYAAGIYFVTINQGKFTNTLKITLLK